jgi:hypothetical protein
MDAPLARELGNLVLFWQGKYKELSSDDCRISDALWEIIGLETEHASKTIPSTFGRQTPNIYKERGQFLAEDWSFWILHIAPHVLNGP